MSALSEIYVKKETLEIILNTLKTKNQTGIGITISINDTSNEYGKNVSAYVAQTKEEQAGKKAKFYVGNGKVFWNDGKIVNGVKPAPLPSVPTEPIANEILEEDLPF